MFNFTEFFIICFIIINLLSIILTVIDKISAINHKNRISEKTLLFIAFIGGAVGMYITMICIAHKVRKMKFMIGLPCIIAIEGVFSAVIINMVKQYV